MTYQLTPDDIAAMNKMLAEGIFCIFQYADGTWYVEAQRSGPMFAGKTLADAIYALRDKMKSESADGVRYTRKYEVTGLVEHTDATVFNHHWPKL